jgi:hypothetical protein
VCGHRGRGPRGGAADDSWLVLMEGLGRWLKLEGASGRVPDKVSGGGAHRSGVPAARGRSSGGQFHMFTSDVEVVAGVTPARSFG